MDDEISSIVKESYRQRALRILEASKDSCCSDGCCSAEIRDSVTCCTESSTDYCCDSSAPVTSQNDCCDSLPLTGSQISFGCVTDFMGYVNPKKGEVVVDLGSGPGKDAIDAANLVETKGMVIGVDFTEEMIKLATENALEQNLENITFVHGDIGNLPLDDGIADVVMSNCVVNLVKDKAQVFKEAYRILKNGGRIIVADMITLASEDELNRLDPEDFCACIGGAVSKDSYIELLENAGFKDVTAIEQSQSNYTKANFTVPYISVIFSGNKL